MQPTREQKQKFIEQYGWSSWYHADYWIHDCLTTERRDKTELGMTLSEAYDHQIDRLTYGTPIGVFDTDGEMIHVGDTLKFDEKEMGAKCVFTLQFRNGRLQHPGAPDDLTQFCKVVSDYAASRTWNA